MRAWLAFLPVVLGCSSQDRASTAAAADTGAIEDVAAEVATPCGTNVGDTLCDLPLQGYVRDAIDGLASSVPATSFETSEAIAAGKQRYAFVFTTAYW